MIRITMCNRQLHVLSIQAVFIDRRLAYPLGLPSLMGRNIRCEVL